MVGPAAKRAVVKDLVRRGKCSERRACWLLAASRMTVRYERQIRSDEAALHERIRKLAAKHKRYGMRRILAMLRREAWRVNKKRVHRIWKEEGLQRKPKRRKTRALGPSRDVQMKAEYPNHVWSYDFTEDRTERGGKLRTFNVVDEFTRECLHIRVDRSIGATKVIASLEWLFLLHGAPRHIRSDNGPELVAKALQSWLEERGAKTIYITPGSPWENAYIESFNDKFRDECLNMHVFTDGRHAQEVIEAWRNEYNTERPHSSLGYKTPSEVAAQWRNSSRPTASLLCDIAQEQRTATETKEDTLTPVGTQTGGRSHPLTGGLHVLRIIEEVRADNLRFALNTACTDLRDALDRAGYRLGMVLASAPGAGFAEIQRPVSAGGVDLSALRTVQVLMVLDGEHCGPDDVFRDVAAVWPPCVRLQE